MADVVLQALPFKEAVQSFRDKGYQVTFDYRDMEKEEHAYAFTVAKAMERDLLQDIRTAVDTAINDGQTLSQFRAGLTPTLKDKGWWGTKEMVDPKTGEKQMVRAGSSRRLQTIFETNMRTSYAAGRWEQVQRTKKTFPYLRYICVLDDQTRDDHRRWHNVVRRVDDPFWKQFYPPNGWGCRCTIQQLSEEDVKRLGLKILSDDYVPDMRSVVNKRTGEVQRVPVGIDPGFNYNVGTARMKALTPPQLDRPLEVPYAGSPSKVAMPAPRVASKDDLLPDGLTNEKYVSAFLDKFDAKMGQPKIFNDVTGEPVIISDDLFRARNGELKVTKRLRHRYLPLLAAAIKEPDEIWNIWHKAPDGSSGLIRRYISRFKVEGQDVPGLAIFDNAKDGWSGVTAFQADSDKYIEGQRQGVLVHRRPDKK